MPIELPKEKLFIQSTIDAQAKSSQLKCGVARWESAIEPILMAGRSTGSADSDRTRAHMICNITRDKTSPSLRSSYIA